MTYPVPIVLASASPRRSKMFSDLGLEFDVIPADIDETMKPNEDPVSYARRVAEEKGRYLGPQLEGRSPPPWIVSADTVVVLNGEVLQKPVDDDDAIRMLRLLRGTTHKVITGWSVGRRGEDFSVNHAETNVTFHPLSDAEVVDYVATNEGMDKAGGYAIQGIGAFLVDRIEGNYYNVVGLPVSHVVRELIRVGAIGRFPRP